MSEKVVELYPEKQGRPASLETRDLETRRGSLYSISTSLLEEYVQVKDLLDKLLNEQITKAQQTLIELQQIKLHLASMSDAPIDEQDVEGE